MSKLFTKPEGQTWQALLNEITLAYSERRQAISQTAYTPTERIVQSAAYWAGLQGWLETNCVLFIDSWIGPYDENKRNYLYFTLHTWRAAAGLNASGFRRKYGPKEALISGYGLMEDRDVIGPWIFEDLQKGLGVLREKKTRIIATKITYAGIDPAWDLTPYQGNGIGVIDGIVGIMWTITGRGMSYGVQNDGDIDDNGKLIDLPNTYIADVYYDGEVNLEVWYFDAGSYIYE